MILFFNIMFFFLTLIIFLSFIFDKLFKRKRGFKYKFKKKFPLKKSHFDFHHNLIFTLKKNYKLPVNNHSSYYPLHGHMSSPNLQTNNLGYFNGINGGKTININKNQNLLRINCMGDSTMANYISDKNDNYFSIPLQIEKNLSKENVKKKIEVNNFGQGQYGFQEIIYKLIFENIYTKPDIIVLYLGYNDIPAYLTGDFNTDYSNYKKNFFEGKNDFFISNFLYDFKINFLNYFLNRFTSYNIRSSIKNYISKGQIDINKDYTKGLASFKKNYEIFSSICASQGIKLIACTFCHYTYYQVQNNPTIKKYDDIINDQNKIIKEICAEKNINYIDMANIIPKEKIYFLDNIHFSENGIKLFASELSKKILKIK